MNSISSDCYYTAEKNPNFESVILVSSLGGICHGINVPVEREKRKFKKLQRPVIGH